ncbi:MAG: response regulator [Bacteroidetes bacterium]|nr:response regulator [Bacteroidota bacterium]
MLKTLIVDDDEVVILIHTQMVKMSGMDNNPLTFLNGKTAFDYINQAKNDENFLVLLDLNMPVWSGWDFLNALNTIKFKNNVFVVIVTSSVDKVDYDRAMKYEQVIDYIEKSLSIDKCKKIMSLADIEKFYN